MAVNFRESTQYKKWFFGSEQNLQKIREGVSSSIQQILLDRISQFSVDDTVLINSIKESCLTYKEESATIQKSIEIMGDLLKSFKFHLHVEATAMIYFKRFLLYHSIMQFDVNILMLTCIFLASKIEENRLKLDDYLRQVEALTKSSIEKNEIRKTELILLQGLQFDLIVYHPYRSLHGIIHDFFEPDRQGEATELYENAKKFIRESYKTDVSFLYAPGTIALAALFHFKPTDTEHFIEKNYASKDIDIEHLMQSIKKIDSIVSALSTDKQQIDSEKAALKSAKMKLKKMKKLIEKYKVFDTVELERQQEEEEMRRRDQKLRQRGEMEKKEIEKLFS